MFNLLQNHMNDEAIKKTFSHATNNRVSPMILQSSTKDLKKMKDEAASSSPKKSQDNQLVNGVKPRIKMSKQEQASHREYLNKLKERARKI